MANAKPDKDQFKIVWEPFPLAQGDWPPLSDGLTWEQLNREYLEKRPWEEAEKNKQH